MAALHLFFPLFSVEREGRFKERRGDMKQERKWQITSSSITHEMTQIYSQHLLAMLKGTLFDVKATLTSEKDFHLKSAEGRKSWCSISVLLLGA